MALGYDLFGSHYWEKEGTQELASLSFGAVLTLVSEGKRQSQGWEGS